MPPPTCPDEEYFRAIPWCAAVLSSPSTYPEPFPSREYKPATTEDALFGTTLRTSKTIAALLGIRQRRRPADTSDEAVLVALAALGSGLNGFPHMCHGGAVATLLDEVTGAVVGINQEQEKKRLKEGVVSAAERWWTAGSFVTAYLNVKYKRPVRTPQVVLLEARLVDRGERKCKIETQVRDKDGTVLAESDGMFVRLKEKL
ncbi:HotDog domain-containing protein [Lineolata rhizophorae]|uniref:HotDog domain-containing protein n=1 Tax=Lineolata rhizophorae TaxID=578093 RepID=A0A6A6PCZ8_9PEZI|nr:HotDog domain-containing protein [Lineolata rhizophorae]